MINNTKEKINHRQRNIYKTLIAVGLGLICFVGTFLVLKFNVGPLNLDFVWSLIFPMLVNLAWGTKYGLISLYIGLGGFHSFYLSKNGGWACFVSFLINLIWFISHGYGLEKRKQSSSYLYNVYFIEIFCLLVNLILYLFLFPLLVKYNPPFWNKSAITTIKIGTI